MFNDNSWKFTVKSFNSFLDILAGVIKNFISRKNQKNKGGGGGGEFT